MVLGGCWGTGGHHRWDDAVHFQGRIEISQRALTVEGQLAVGSETDNQTKLLPGVATLARKQIGNC